VFYASSSFGDNHSDIGHIHCNSSNESAQVAAIIVVVYVFTTLVTLAMRQQG
jgi:hypothetical protein